MGRVCWGAALFVGLGWFAVGCGSKHDDPSNGSAGGPLGSGGMIGSEAGNAALGGTANGDAGAHSGGAGGADHDDMGNAGSMELAGAAGAGDSGSSSGGTDNGAAGKGGAATAGNAGSGGSCQAFEASVSATAPTVFVLVDRSSSMFLCLSGSAQQTGLNCADPNDTPWGALKQSMLEVVQELQGSVRFGFGSFTGQNGGICPSFSAEGPALNNYDAIHAAYENLAAPTFKAETPTAQALGMAQTLLLADTAPGPKYVLLATDGEPDFCDDGPPSCPVDATVSQLQHLYAAGVGTFILGVDSPLISISGASLQAFANAGAGLAVTDPSGMGTGIYYNCSTTTAWTALFAATGKAAPAAIASYGMPASNATVYRPNASNAAALKQALAGPVAGVKSCTFDLAAGLSVELNAISTASVSIQGQSITQSASNGWSMVNNKRLQLNGSACTLWRSPTSQSIGFDFPCGSVTKQ